MDTAPRPLAMQDYRVHLDVYHGPLDLLLHLIKRNEVDIHDIPIHRITEQYLQHVATLKALDINLAGEFLVMAATLMEIKSAMIAPREESDEDADAADDLTASEDPTDPRYELVQQLLAYKRFKDAARALENRRTDFAARFPRRPARIDLEAAAEHAQQQEPELDVEDVSVWDLVEAFNRLMEQVGSPPEVDVTQDDTPLELYQADLLDRLGRDGPMTLQEMFAGRGRLAEMIGLFLATLELLRQQKVRATQKDRTGPIYLQLREDAEEDDAADAGEEAATQAEFDPEEPENFEWPDEQTRRRYERRIARRKRGEKIEEDEQFAEDVAAIEAEESFPTGEAASDTTAEAEAEAEG